MLSSVAGHPDTPTRKALETEVFVRDVAERVARSSGIDLIDIEMKRGAKGPLVRVFLDKPGRINLEELENASREISAILDVEDPIGRSYTLEVSSPGMTRPLKTPADFARALEKNVQITFTEATADPADRDLSVTGENPSGTVPETVPETVKEVKGRLLAVTDREVRILPRDRKGREGAEVVVSFAALRHAQREISFR